MKTTTSITIDNELLKKLDLIAKTERRTRSNMLELIISDIKLPKKTEATNESV